MIVEHAELRVVPVRTPTLPPATHTNCYVLGRRRLTLVDPASPWEEEQERLAQLIEGLAQDGARVERVLLTHHHGDHVGGATHIAERLGVPIVAHPRTAELLRGRITISDTLIEGDTLSTDSETWQVLHTPGHASGHLCLYNADSGAVVAGDMVAGVGTIVLEPPEGVLRLYLASLQRLLDLKPAVLFPAHGPDIRAAEALLGYYIHHRHSRTQQIREALAQGPASPELLVERVYGDTIPQFVYPIAASQVRCHLAWLLEQGELGPPEGETWSA